MIVAAITVATGILRISYSYFVSEELAMSEGRLSLYQSTVNAEFDRFSHLTYVLSRDTFVMQTAQGGETNALNQRLAEFTQQAGLDAIYLMDTTGRTIAASNYGDASSFIDQNYSFRPYFQQALLGGQGRFYAIGTTTGLPGYFIADAVRDADGVIRGVIAIKIGFSQLEESWRRSGEQVLLTNEDGVVLLSSDPAWRYQVLEALTETQRAHIENSRQFSGQALAPLDWVSLPDHRAEIAGTDRLHLMAETLPHGWELHYFASDDRAVARSWLVIIFAVLLAGIALIFLQRQRARRVAAALRSSEQEEAKLRRANDRLAVEISERNTAERRLKRTEQELERASRLAALGQLSASVTHELGQPIAAMRNHLTAAEMNPKKATGLTSKIGSLVDRMEGITRELKFFARSENIEFKDVDLSEALQVALGLVAPNIDAYGVEIQTFLPEEAVLIRGNKLRIEQVMTNLLRNAIDATEDSDRPIVQITLETVACESRLTISDNGHGLGKSTLSELQEPFVTTRESGRGMGLGLAISTSIIHDHGGAVTAKNNDAGGAVFVVSFPMPDAEVE
ncbi:sensor histidine kinase [Cochlodiniinecator piscidefendens]|uniref:sensor histidine kinase n=1 Tax=Cochlodiniinecator piscidefendens TaxID=2715756 RepID=UPI001E627A35|nr:cache domain-containing protein [Cochlodiniinecator piscidefendens]